MQHCSRVCTCVCARTGCCWAMALAAVSWQISCEQANQVWTMCCLKQSLLQLWRCRIPAATDGEDSVCIHEGPPPDVQLLEVLRLLQQAPLNVSLLLLLLLQHCIREVPLPRRAARGGLASPQAGAP